MTTIHPSSTHHILDKHNLSKARCTSFPAHGYSQITCLSLLPDGRIITASDDHTVQIHSPSGEKLLHFEGHTGGVWCMDTYEDTLVTGSTDRTIRVWDMKEGRCTHVFPGHSSTVRVLQIVRPELVNTENEDGVIVQEEWPKKPVIVSGSRDHDLRIWELPRPGADEYHPDIEASSGDPVSSVSENPYHLHHLEGHEDAVRGVSARGRICVSASYDTTLRVWDIITGECRWVLRGHTLKVYAVELDLSRHQAYSGSMDGTLKIWDLKTGICKHTLGHHTSLVGIVKLTPAPAHSHLISGSADASVCIWDPSNGSLLHRFMPRHFSLSSDDPDTRPGAGAITALACDESRVVYASDWVLSVVGVEGVRVPVSEGMRTALGSRWVAVAFDEARVVACGTNEYDAAVVRVWEGVSE